MNANGNGAGRPSIITRDRVEKHYGDVAALDATLTREAGERLGLEVAALGRLEVPRAQAPGGLNGGRISVGIRPEMLTILFDETDHAEREISGEVVDVNDHGDMTYYDVRLPGAEKPATISMRNTAGRRILREGATARVGWSPDSLVVLD